ncbi:hypothetical protein YN1_6640 [Nanoarchaeota archaeon]
MRSQYYSRGTAFVIALLIIAAIIGGYSYVVYHGNFLEGFYQLYDIIKNTPLQALFIFLAGIIIGYFQGKATV